MSSEIKRLSKKVSWLLRHGAKESGLQMDSAGWVALSDVSSFLRVSPATLAKVVVSNNKQRYEVDSGRIRASQGHSLSGTPVELEVLEKSWSSWHGEVVWHGTSISSCDEIVAEGVISAMSRTHVHLAESLVSHVGKRANVAIGLRIQCRILHEAGLGLFQSSNGVILCREVPITAIDGFVPLTKRARAMADQLEERWDVARVALSNKRDG